MDATHEFGDGTLFAAVRQEGAELCSLRDPAGAEWLWTAGPEWPRHAPVLFPVVGRLHADRYRYAGRDYPMGQHGFVRDRRFEWTERRANGCALILRDDAATREAYPFAFALELDYALRDGALHCVAAVRNPGAVPLPFSIGGHPGFAWPLPGASRKDDHAVIFAENEPGPVLRVSDGLLGDPAPSPVRNRRLALSESLFAVDAVVLPGVRSRALRLESAAGPALAMEWDGYGDLGIWSKPGGAPFLCLEPWCGHASPVGWEGEIADKPGIVLLPPGGERRFRWSVRPEPVAAGPG